MCSATMGSQLVQRAQKIPFWAGRSRSSGSRNACRGRRAQTCGRKNPKRVVVTSAIPYIISSDAAAPIIQLLPTPAVEFLVAQQEATFGLLTGVPYLDAFSVFMALVYLTATPGVGIGAIDSLILSPLDLLLQKKIEEDDVTLGRKIGDGSFGKVYSGLLRKAYSGNTREIVVKKCKPVPNSDQMQRAEEYMNRRIRRDVALRGSVAPYLGSFDELSGIRTNSFDAPTLVWDLKGVETLEKLLARRDFPLCLENDLFGKENKGDEQTRERRVIQRVMRQVFTALSAMHSTGIVHRDIKPANLVLMENRFRVIDFGAAADLRIGKNYDPENALLDPGYCPPEQFVMPEDTPRPPNFAPLAAALSPFVWALNRPDLFDCYSAGIVLLQLALAPLRAKNSVQSNGTFQRDLEMVDWDLQKWRNKFTGPQWDFTLLDMNGGSGWDLACRLVCTRNKLTRRGRLGASQAMLHPFLLESPF